MSVAYICGCITIGGIDRCVGLTPKNELLY